ncbi:hypothetical protein Z052_15450 [Halorubrum sp. C191]|uniref:hypothetical protein n=1 Tax=Halorubrum sp. C191 TaxID=1383842 RepID=UPI000C06B115|nr:hypothetical protein [Halorubrum sp. C191]PHQ41268.1 hypothetical protein Z052_15450 [Halorubrum sp. C191]
MDENNIQNGEYSLEILDGDDGLLIGSVKDIGDGMHRLEQHVAVEASTEGALIKQYEKIEDSSTGSWLERAVPVEIVGIDHQNLITERFEERLKSSLFKYAYDSEFMTIDECEEIVGTVAEQIAEVIDEWFADFERQLENQGESQN